MPVTEDEPASAPGHARPAHDVVVAIRNAFILGGSLVATWSVALVARLYIPRALGPERFGVFNFADALAATCAVGLGLGIDTYVQKEIPARPEHGSDFMGGVLVARTLLAVVMLIGMEAIVIAGHRSLEVQRTVCLFGIAQVMSTNANTFAGVIHASQRVGRLAIINVSAKLLWGAGIALALATHAGLEGFALAFLVSETLRAVVLWWLLRTRLGLRLRIDVAASKRAVVASLAFYVNAAAVIVYAKVDITIMATLSSDSEVGFYGAASNIASIAFLLAPIVSWVLIPQLSRVAARSTEELLVLFRRSVELLLALTIPVSMMMALGADMIILTVFRNSFAPAITSLRVLAPMFVLTYLAMLTASTLMLIGRGWRTTVISVVSVAANALLNVLLLRPGQHALGVGGAGTTASAIWVATELLVAIAMFFALGRGSVDRPMLLVLGKSLAACVVTVGLHLLLAPLGAWRLALDLVIYVAIVAMTRAVRIGEISQFVRAAATRGKGT